MYVAQRCISLTKWLGELHISPFVCVYRTDSAASEGSAAQRETPTKLKRARLADDLNEKIALRPGPLELVEKNIIPADSTVKEAAMRGIGGRNEKRWNVFQLPEKYLVAVTVTKNISLSAQPSPFLFIAHLSLLHFQHFICIPPKTFSNIHLGRTDQSPCIKLQSLVRPPK